MSTGWLCGAPWRTAADFAVAVTQRCAERAHTPLDQFRATKRWRERLNELDAWRKPFPDWS